VYLIWSLQAGNFVREEILSSFIRLVAHTPELQAYTASKLYLALKADLSQESLTLAATWVLGEYSEITLQSGIIDDDQTVKVSHLLKDWKHLKLSFRSRIPTSSI
jgi:AP-1 complex subunit gamma-1